MLSREPKVVSAVQLEQRGSVVVFLGKFFYVINVHSDQLIEMLKCNKFSNKLVQCQWIFSVFLLANESVMINIVRGLRFPLQSFQ